MGTFDNATTSIRDVGDIRHHRDTPISRHIWRHNQGDINCLYFQGTELRPSVRKGDLNQVILQKECYWILMKTFFFGPSAIFLIHLFPFSVELFCIQQCPLYYDITISHFAPVLLYPRSNAPQSTNYVTTNFPLLKPKSKSDT